MAVPLVLAFAGLLAGRELVQGGQRRRARERRLTEEQAHRLATGSLLGEGRGEFGRTDLTQSYGPPTPIGTRAFTDLNPNQIARLDIMRVNDPEAAHEEAAALVLSNQTQANTLVEQQLNQGKLDLQRDQHNQGVIEHNDAQNELRLGRIATQNELDIANRSMVDPDFAMAQAAKNGDSTYALGIQQPDGTTTYQNAPMPNNPLFIANQEAIRIGGGLLGTVNKVRGTMQRVGLEVLRDPSFATSREVEAQVTQVLLQLKEMEALGVLAGSDLELLLAEFPDPTSFVESLISNPGALDAAMAQTAKRIESQLGQSLQQQIGWRATDDAETARALASIQGSQMLDARSAQVVQQEQAALARGDRLTSIDNLAKIGAGAGGDLSLREQRAALLEFGSFQSGAAIRRQGPVIQPSELGAAERSATRALAESPGAIASGVAGLVTGGLLRR